MAYIGVNGKARKIKSVYIGVDGKARKVKAGYIGVDGKARLFYKQSNKSVKYLKTIANVVDGSICPSSTVFNGNLYVGNGFSNGMTSAQLNTMYIISPDLTKSQLNYSSMVDTLGGLVQLGLCSNDNVLLSCGGYGPTGATGKYYGRQLVFSMTKDHVLTSHGYTYGYANCCVSGCRFNNSQKMLFAGGFYRWSSDGAASNVVMYDGSITRTDVGSLSLASKQGTGMAAIQDKILVASTNIGSTYIGTTSNVYGIASYKESDLSASFSYNLKTSSRTYDAAVAKCGDHILHASGVRKTTSSGSSASYSQVYAFDYNLNQTFVGYSTYKGRFYRAFSNDFNGKALIYGCFDGSNLLTIDVYNPDLTKQDVEVKTTIDRPYSLGAQIGDYYLIIGGTTATSADVYVEE